MGDYRRIISRPTFFPVHNKTNAHQECEAATEHKTPMDDEYAPHPSRDPTRLDVPRTHDYQKSRGHPQDQKHFANQNLVILRIPETSYKTFASILMD